MLPRGDSSSKDALQSIETVSITSLELSFMTMGDHLVLVTLLPPNL